MTDPLAPLRERFRARAAEDLTRLTALVAGDLAAQELQILTHNLAGAAGTFGYGPLSEAAMAIDDRYASDRLPEPEQITLLQQRLQDVAEPRD